MVRGASRTWVIALAVTVLCLAVVVPTVMVFNPPDAWPIKVPVGATLTVILAFPISYGLGWQTERYARVVKELELLVNRDRLTEVATRDYFFSRIEELPDAYGVSLMIDIDHFKRINDTHGHLAGDAVIRDVATTLSTYCRGEDIVCRFGGEEFVVFLYRADAKRGGEIAERMRRAVASQAIEVDGKRVSVTVSIGGALKADVHDIDRAIKAADTALYRAKRLGRNRAVMTWRATSRDSVLQGVIG